MYNLENTTKVLSSSLLNLIIVIFNTNALQELLLEATHLLSIYIFYLHVLSCWVAYCQPFLRKYDDDDVEDWNKGLHSYWE